MAKAKRVFESPGTFLSFPALAPVSLSSEELRFGSGGEMSREDLLEASFFSRMANQLPRSVIAPLDEGEYMWDVYRDILRSARVASGTMTAGEKAAYDAALAILYTTGEDGLRTDSPRLTTYKQHRDAVFEAEEEYRNQQLTAEASADPALQDQWKNVDESRLRMLVQERLAAFETSGFKAEIEAAQQIESAGAANAASSVWAEWRGLFIDDLDLPTDQNNVAFAMTGYSPTDILDVDNWPRFTLSGEEIAQLAEQAPPELRDIFASGSAASDIESLSFEYRSIAVVRPWFKPALFKARFWRLPDGAEPLSDGAEPPGGRLPAYVSAMVLARNVVIKHKERIGGGSEGSTIGPALLRVDPAILNPHLRQLVRARLQTQPAMEVERGAVHERPATVDTSRVALRLRSASFSGARISTLSTASVAPSTVPTGGLRLRALIGRPTLAEVMHTAAPESAPETSPPPEPAPQPAPPPQVQDEIIVLAFICKRLARTPDPDPALAWA